MTEFFVSACSFVLMSSSATVVADENHRIQQSGGEQRLSDGKKKHGVLRPA